MSFHCAVLALMELTTADHMSGLKTLSRGLGGLSVVQTQATAMPLDLSKWHLFEQCL